MRRIVVGLVIVLVGAGFAGVLAGSSAISIGGSTSVSTSTLRAELAVIASHPDYACYLGPALGTAIAATSSQISATTAAEWTALQVKGVAVERYDAAHYGWHVTAAELAAAAQSYESDLTNLVANYEVSCPDTAAAAIGALPTWFRTGQLVQDAASEVYTQHVKGAVSLTTSALRAIYTANPAAYDTICAALVEVPDGARAKAFLNASEHSRETPAQLAKTYSIDASAKTGGVLGCFVPSSSDYSAVVSFTSQLALNHFPTTPQDDADGDSYFLAPTKRTANTFAQVETVILEQAETANAQVAAQDQDGLLASSDIAVNPEFGQWTPTKATVEALVSPNKADTPNRGAGLSF